MDRVRNQKYPIMVMLFVAVLLVIQLFLYMKGSDNEPNVVQISIIAYGTDDSRWENLKQGAEQAASDDTAEVSVITMSADGDASEQQILMEREIENGADALMIAASDSEKLSEIFKEYSPSVPVIFVENGLSEQSQYGFITSDNYRMGVKLANEIIANEKDWIKTAIVTENMERESIRERYQGVYDTLKPYADNIVIWNRNEKESNLIAYKFLQRWIIEDAADVVITLDSETTEALVDAMDNINRTRKVYSVANSDKTVYNLDHGKIKAIEYQDEFMMGYLGMKELLTELGHEKKPGRNETVEAKIIGKDDVYAEENQKLLFPFVK